MTPSNARTNFPNYRHRSAHLTRTAGARPDPKGGIARDARLNHPVTWRLH